MGAATLNTTSKKLNMLMQLLNRLTKRKVIAYGEIAKIYDLEGQQLIDAVTKEHDLIDKLTASGMTFEQIGEIANNSSVNFDTLGQPPLYRESQPI